MWRILELFIILQSSKTAACDIKIIDLKNITKGSIVFQIHFCDVAINVVDDQYSLMLRMNGLFLCGNAS